MMIEEKYTSNRKILIGLTIDYRDLEDWQSFKENKEPMLREIIQRSINTHNLAPNISSKNRPFVQTHLRIICNNKNWILSCIVTQ